MNDYEKQAEQFLKDTGTMFKAVFTEHRKYFDNDKETRDVYEIALIRQGKKPFVFSFGQSINNSGTINKYIVLKDNYEPAYKKDNIKRKRIAPTSYDVLANLTKYDVGSFENFCSEFGYDIDSRSAEKIYIAVIKEQKEVERLFGDVMDKLQDIN